LLWRCSLPAPRSKQSGSRLLPPAFPYQAYLDSIGEDEVSPTIGDDGQGFNAISHNIRYPAIPGSLKISTFADSLLQYYNIALAFNSMAYDIGTAERYMSDHSLRLAAADALGTVNLEGITSPEIKEQLRNIGTNAASWLRKGLEPDSQKNEAVSRFYDLYDQFTSQLLPDSITKAEYNPGRIVDNYDKIHAKALIDTTFFRHDLLYRVLSATDFARKCVLAREYAYSNYIQPQRNDEEVVAVIDNILRANKYSPLLRDLWRMWRVLLQSNIFAGPSNDSAMYNLFYNDMRNRIALVYIAHLNTHPTDGIALKKFISLSLDHNIVRNSACLFGNNALFDEIEHCQQRTRIAPRFLAGAD
jgi:hypothetical protein